MEELENEFLELKISAFSKLAHTNSLTPKSNVITEEKIILEPSDKIRDSNDFNNYNVPIRHVLKELETERQERVRNAVEAKINELKSFTKNNAINNKQEWAKRQQAFIDEMYKKEHIILNTMHQHDTAFSNEQAKRNLHYQNLLENRRKKEVELKAKEQAQKTLHENINKIRKFHSEFSSTYKEIFIYIKAILETEHKGIYSEENKRIKSVLEIFNSVIKKCDTGKVEEEDVNKCLNCIDELKKLRDIFKNGVKKIKDERDKIETEKTEAANRKLLETAQAKEAAQAADQTVVQTVAAKVSFSENNQQFVHPENLQMYIDIMNFAKNYSQKYENLLNDNNFKQFKFDCKKAINIPVNAISGVSVGHIMDKYQRLHKLLAGQNVTVADKNVNASEHPQGIAFCTDLLAQKFVLQGDLMISSNPESAFCYATIISSLWNEFPDLGKLILANFYKTCPYLVPYYIPQTEGESDEDFYQKLGYQYNNGQIEKQDKFLKRMTGVMRLYAAILITVPKRGQTAVPHNIKNGWRWMASILHLEPQMDITATMLHAFLETVGFKMEENYGNSFRKIIKYLMQKYLPLCRLKCTGGAVTRLELLLTDYYKNRKFDVPDGYVPHSYW